MLVFEQDCIIICPIPEVIPKLNAAINFQNLLPTKVKYRSFAMTLGIKNKILMKNKI